MPFHNLFIDLFDDIFLIEYILFSIHYIWFLRGFKAMNIFINNFNFIPYIYVQNFVKYKIGKGH
ncbi:MAG: hypothetical protein BWY70_01300 [Bacteroidetes bacterium ADurb.Bin408]|nr:MAG: hypothetical protein BWY70_01300 [Bacteroidetes bacterium ADurb.Bin408]